MEGRVEETDDDGKSLHLLQDAVEVFLLHDLELIEGGDALFIAVGHHEALHDGKAVGGHEHVLRAAEADAPGAEGPGTPGVLGGVAVGPDLETGIFVGPGKDGLEVVAEGGFHERGTAEKNAARAAVHGDGVSLADDLVAL